MVSCKKKIIKCKKNQQTLSTRSRAKTHTHTYRHKQNQKQNTNRYVLRCVASIYTTM